LDEVVLPEAVLVVVFYHGGVGGDGVVVEEVEVGEGDGFEG
jgi:hypothetical protein